MFRSLFTTAAVFFSSCSEDAPQAIRFRVAMESGLVATAEGAGQPGPILPGQKYVFEVSAQAGDRLSLLSTFGVSNDWFTALGDDGLELFTSAGSPINGDFTSRLTLWNAGTEVDEEPAVGANVAPNQAAPNTGGIDPNATVRLLEPEFHTATVASHLKLTITPL